MWCGLTILAETQLVVALQTGLPYKRSSSHRPISEEVVGGAEQLGLWPGIDWPPGSSQASNWMVRLDRARSSSWPAVLPTCFH